MRDRFDLTGHVAVVTGGNGGIGLGMATGLAEAGAHVALWGRDEAKNERAAGLLDEVGPGRVRTDVCDVADQEQVTAALAATIADLGRVDSCFANAGIFPHRVPFVELTIDEWRRVMAVDLEGVFFTLQAAARHMVDRGGGGALVATSSIASIYGQPLGEHYGAAKAGTDAMIRALAVELGRHGIRANALLPGWVVVEATEALYEEANFKDKVQRRVPLRRWGIPDDLAAAAVFMATPSNAYFTGQTLVVDGGYSVF